MTSTSKNTDTRVESPTEEHTAKSASGYLRRGASVLLTLFLVALVAVFVVQAVPGVVGADHSYVVLSGSMSPTINPGDSVLVTDVAPSSIQVGDVITFRRTGDGTRVTHQVVEILHGDDGLAFRTKGVNNEDPDPSPVPARNVVGRVTTVLPYVGYVVLFTNQWYGMVALVGLPLAGLVALEFMDILRSDGRTRSATPRTTAGETTRNEIDDEATAVGDRTATSKSNGKARSTADETAVAEAGVDGTFVLTRTDIQLSLVGFGAFAVYSGYVAYRDPAMLSIVVAVGTAASTLLLLGVYVAAGSDGDSGGDSIDRDEATPSGREVENAASDAEARPVETGAFVDRRWIGDDADDPSGGDDDAQ